MKKIITTIMMLIVSIPFAYGQQTYTRESVNRELGILLEERDRVIEKQKTEIQSMDDEITRLDGENRYLANRNDVLRDQIADLDSELVRAKYQYPPKPHYGWTYVLFGIAGITAGTATYYFLRDIDESNYRRYCEVAEDPSHDHPGCRARSNKINERNYDKDAYEALLDEVEFQNEASKWGWTITSVGLAAAAVYTITRTHGQRRAWEAQFGNKAVSIEPEADIIDSNYKLNFRVNW